MELYMKHVKTVAVCAVVALGVGATSATAGSLITGGKIKDGTVAMRDLTPGVQATIKQRPIARLAPVPTVSPVSTALTALLVAAAITASAARAASTASTASTAGTGATGEHGLNGWRWQRRPHGEHGLDGHDGVRFERITGSCVSDVAPGEVMVRNDGACQIELPNVQMAYAAVPQLPEQNLTVADVTKLSFRVKTPGYGRQCVPEGQARRQRVCCVPPDASGARATDWTKYNVAHEDSKLRCNDDAGFVQTYSLAELQVAHGDLAIKSREITGRLRWRRDQPARSWSMT